jgi:hypothetical protein
MTQTKQPPANPARFTRPLRRSRDSNPIFISDIRQCARRVAQLEPFRVYGGRRGHRLRVPDPYHPYHPCVPAITCMSRLLEQPERTWSARVNKRGRYTGQPQRGFQFAPMADARKAEIAATTCEPPVGFLCALRLSFQYSVHLTGEPSSPAISEAASVPYVDRSRPTKPLRLGSVSFR